MRNSTFMDDNALSDAFLRLFSPNIDDLQVSLEEALPSQLSVDIPTQLCSNMLTNFCTIKPDTTRDIIMNSSTKSCTLDPLPTCILKDCLDVLVDLFTSIINSSILTGKVHRLLKSQLFIDPELFKNYRPISNTPFLIKTIEPIIARQIQSAYRKHHSTETALLRVQNDIIQAVDLEYEVFLVLLDFTAAFDTIDHSILLTRLEQRFGISGKAWKWPASYREDRTQFVSVNNLNSTTSTVKYGVAQGPILGPPAILLICCSIGEYFKSTWH